MTLYMTQMDFVKDFVAVANIFRPLRIFVRESAIQKESRYSYEVCTYITSVIV